MKAREALGVFRHLAVLNQWGGLQPNASSCRTCKASAPDHLRSCILAEALEATAEKEACPRCFGDPGNHAPQCPKAAKA